MADPVTHEKRVKFDPTINLGHLLSLAAFFIAGMGAWSAFDKRLTIIEEGRKIQEQIDRAQDSRLASDASRLAELVGNLTRQVERLNDRLEKTKGP